MPSGILRISTFALRQSAPVPWVQVEITSPGLAVSLTTDEHGLAEDVVIDAPDKRYSFEENNDTIQPWTDVCLTATAAGYAPLTVNGIQIFDGQVTLAQLELTPAVDLPPVNGTKTTHSEVVDIPPHVLFAGGGGSGDEYTEEIPNAEYPERVLNRVIIPRSITVHLGAPSAAVQNVTVGFRQYIANVASSEVYPTWPEEALKANILAQISLALNRIFTEWYPSRGYNFNITGSPSYDQAYVRGRTIFEVMQRLTDELFDTYIRRAGHLEPLFAQYCDGKSVKCSGMSQWGSVDRAKRGESARQILRFYYGSNIETVTSKEILAIPASYPGSSLRRGSSGENVKILQRQLNRIARDYPAFGTVTVDGKFGPATEAVVKRFQKQFGLAADGIVGKKTWYKVSYIYVSVTDLAELTSEGIAQTGTVAYPGVAMRRGDSGGNVRTIQTWLNGVAAVNASLDPIAADGKFGPATESAVKAFQRLYGLTADGVVGRATWTRLNQAYLDVTGRAARAEAAPSFPLREGDSGASVEALSQQLALVAYFYPAVQSLGVTQYYDDILAESVRSFQKRFGLPETGEVDPNTWDSLEAAYYTLLEAGREEAAHG